MSNRAEKLALLQAIFGCGGDAAAEIGRLAVWSRVERGAILAHQGDLHGLCHIIIAGSAAVSVLGSDGQVIQIATIEPGEVFGVYPDPRELSADVRASTAVEMVSFDCLALKRAAREHSEIGAGLARIFSRQLDGTLDRFAARVSLTAAGRVYLNLLGLADAQGLIGKAPSVAALAVQAQTTRETASRALGVLERRGILQRGGESWLIVSRRLLEDMVY